MHNRPEYYAEGPGPGISVFFKPLRLTGRTFLGRVQFRALPIFLGGSLVVTHLYLKLVDVQFEKSPNLKNFRVHRKK